MNVEYKKSLQHNVEIKKDSWLNQELILLFSLFLKSFKKKKLKKRKIL